ncbi:MAG TPA: alpha-amylase family glycosyl hydrolase, partial [Phycisphaerae bacterium]|nr:alpha-amylase family glycosyl hydrolase [Phycisphaerae bacterium]
MGFVEDSLSSKRPSAVRPVVLPRRTKYFPSPADWRDEVIYFLLPDRFSDGQEATRPMLDVNNRQAARPTGFRFDQWAFGGGDRYQGGTIAGIKSKLAYLKGLGVTTLWVGPVFKQRTHWDSYHGYAIQDYLEVDPRLGTRKDLVDLVAAAHAMGLRILLDVIFNHTGNNWVYNGQGPNDADPAYIPWPNYYPKGPWRNRTGNLLAPGADPAADDDGVWPSELWPDDLYTR